LTKGTAILKPASMQAWQQLVWNSLPETDVHRESARDPYEQRSLQSPHLGPPKPRITDFVSQYAIGDRLACSLELLVRSHRLIEDSRATALRIRMRLLLYAGKSIQ
jgi:hypothetical protein